jgi:hypothetical protein
MSRFVCLFACLAMLGFISPNVLAEAAKMSIAFNQPADLAGWQSDYETWKIEDGVLTQSPAVSAERGSIFWFTDRQFSDFTLTVDFRIVPDIGAIPTVGVLYRAKSTSEYCSAELDTRAARQSAGISHASGGRTGIAPKSAKTPAIQAGEWHTLKVVANGAKQELSLDNQLLVSNDNPAMKEGAIGLRIGTAPVQFRNLTIDGPSTTPASPLEVRRLPFVTVCSDGGAGGYEGFPDLCTTQSGDLLCVFYAGFKHVPSGPNEKLPRGGKICSARSQDGGKTWSKPQTIYDSPADDHDPQITRLADGRIAVTICSYPIRGTHHPFIIWSNDDGHTWSEGKELDHPLAATEVPQGPIVEMPGRLLMPTYGVVDKADKATAAVVRISRDGGKTWPWTPGQVLRSSLTGPDDKSVTEPCIVRLPGNRLMLVARPVMLRWESTDAGETWTPMDPMPVRGDSPNLFLISKNVLLCGIRFRGEAKTGNNRGTAVLSSTDDGKTWSAPTLIAPVIGGYTGMAELPDGWVFIVYYTEGPGSDIRGTYLRVDRDGGVKVVGEKD